MLSKFITYSLNSSEFEYNRNILQTDIESNVQYNILVFEVSNIAIGLLL